MSENAKNEQVEMQEAETEEVSRLDKAKEVAARVVEKVKPVAKAAVIGFAVGAAALGIAGFAASKLEGDDVAEEAEEPEEDVPFETGEAKADAEEA